MHVMRTERFFAKKMYVGGAIDWKINDVLESQQHLTLCAENGCHDKGASSSQTMILSVAEAFTVIIYHPCPECSSCFTPHPYIPFNGLPFIYIQESFSSFFFFMNLLEKVPLGEETCYAHQSRL